MENDDDISVKQKWKIGHRFPPNGGWKNSSVAGIHPQIRRNFLQGGVFTNWFFKLKINYIQQQHIKIEVYFSIKFQSQSMFSCIPGAILQLYLSLLHQLGAVAWSVCTTAFFSAFSLSCQKTQLATFTFKIFQSNLSPEGGCWWNCLRTVCYRQTAKSFFSQWVFWRILTCWGSFWTSSISSTLLLCWRRSFSERVSDVGRTFNHRISGFLQKYLQMIQSAKHSLSPVPGEEEGWRGSWWNCLRTVCFLLCPRTPGKMKIYSQNISIHAAKHFFSPEGWRRFLMELSQNCVLSSNC